MSTLLISDLKFISCTLWELHYFQRVFKGFFSMPPLFIYTEQNFLLDLFSCYYFCDKRCKKSDTFWRNSTLFMLWAFTLLILMKNWKFAKILYYIKLSLRKKMENFSQGLWIVIYSLNIFVLQKEIFCKEYF